MQMVRHMAITKETITPIVIADNAKGRRIIWFLLIDFWVIRSIKES